MSNVMEYKGYVGNIEFSPEYMIFFGKVQGIRSLISYEGTNAVELVNDFHAAVDDYLESCKRCRSLPICRNSYTSAVLDHSDDYIHWYYNQRIQKKTRLPFSC